MDTKDLSPRGQIWHPQNWPQRLLEGNIAPEKWCGFPLTLNWCLRDCKGSRANVILKSSWLSCSARLPGPGHEVGPVQIRSLSSADGWAAFENSTRGPPDPPSSAWWVVRDCTRGTLSNHFERNPPVVAPLWSVVVKPEGSALRQAPSRCDLFLFWSWRKQQSFILYWCWHQGVSFFLKPEILQNAVYNGIW